MERAEAGREWAAMAVAVQEEAATAVGAMAAADSAVVGKGVAVMAVANPCSTPHTHGCHQGHLGTARSCQRRSACHKWRCKFALR